MRDCEQHWQDVFLTRADYEQKDDAFVTPVMSVQINDTGTEITAVQAATNLLAVAFPATISSPELAALQRIQVGDMIRVGTEDLGAHTDYVTVLEIKTAGALVNTFSVGLDIGGGAVLAAPSGSTYASTPLTGPVQRVFRINRAVDATSIPAGLTTSSTTTSARTPVTMTTRSSVVTPKQLLPMYHQQRWTPSQSILRMQMPTNIKQIGAIKLVGYQMVHKRLVGVHQQHDLAEDDYFILRLREVTGSVLSNNSYANGALHVLKATNSHLDPQTVGSTQLYEYDPRGLVCAELTPTNLPSLTVEVTDRFGRAAHFGRMHIWLRVLVTGS